MITAPRHAKEDARRRGLGPSPRGRVRARSSSSGGSGSPRLDSPTARLARQQSVKEHRAKRRALADWAAAEAELVVIERELVDTRGAIAELAPPPTAGAVAPAAGPAAGTGPGAAPFRMQPGCSWGAPVPPMPGMGGIGGMGGGGMGGGGMGRMPEPQPEPEQQQPQPEAGLGGRTLEEVRAAFDFHAMESARLSAPDARRLLFSLCGFAVDVRAAPAGTGTHPQPPPPPPPPLLTGRKGTRS